MLALTVKMGETVELEHAQHGPLGSFRIDRMPNGGSYAVRILFDMPRAIIIRAINRASTNSFGLRGERPESGLHQTAA